MTDDLTVECAVCGTSPHPVCMAEKGNELLLVCAKCCDDLKKAGWVEP